jgi:hypothetical protein
MSLVGELWKGLSDEDREEWNAKAKANANASSSDTDESSDVEPQSDTEVVAVKKTPVKKSPAKKAPKKTPVKKGKKAEESVETSDVDDEMPIMDASD